jgi:histidinol-phosphate aminotransferase
VTVAAEALIVLPAFDMYASCADAAGLHVAQVPPNPDLSFPLDRVIAAMTSATRILFITTPGNPTGEPLPSATVEALRDALPGEAILFIDEAYVGFGQESLSGRLGRHGANRAQVLVGRTFSKTHGLAGVRAGALMGDADLIQDVARLVPPYSINAFAVAAVRAAVRDTAYVEWYAREVATSRAMLFELCDRLGVFCWRSEANFVLVKVGDRSADVVHQLAGRGIAVRDRGNEPGCAGCIRITAGVVEHTRRVVDAMEQILCGAR